jgi:hypothetical protein
LTGEDRLEVTQNTTAYCVGPELDIDLIKKAVQQLDAVEVDRTQVVIIGQATLSEMNVNLLTSITADAKLAVTPIVNFGGNNYSKNTITKTTYYVSLTATPVAQTLVRPSPSTVIATPQPSVLPPPQPEAGPVPPSAPSAAPVVPSARPPGTIVLPPEQFKASVPASNTVQTIEVTRATKK